MSGAGSLSFVRRFGASTRHRHARILQRERDQTTIYFAGQCRCRAYE